VQRSVNLIAALLLHALSSAEAVEERREMDVPGLM